MPKVVLYYFNTKGLGEAPRMLMAYGGQEFEDRRLSREEWAAFRPETPFGQLPVLEWDGLRYSQSNAICRFLGRKFDLVGNNPEEMLEIDQNVDYFCDLLTEAAEVFFEEDGEVKAKKQDEAEKNVYPQMLKTLEEIVIKNRGHIAVGKITWGDFLVAGMYEVLPRILQIPNLYVQYPNLKRVYESVVSIPQVKTYIDGALKSEY